MKQTLRTILASSVFSLAFSALRLAAQCPTVEAVMVDACGPESFNEFIIIHSGSGFNTADLMVDYDPSNNVIGAVNNDINMNNGNWPADPTPCGLTTGNAAAYTGCPNLIAVGSGVNIPANAIVVLQTSASATNGLYNFSALCGAGQCVFVISSTCVRSAGAFTNGSGAGTRTTAVYFGSGCADTFTYDRALLGGTNGDYFLPPTGTYGNAGCVVPPSPPAPPRPNISPIANVSVCASYTLPAITGTNLTPNAAYFTGTNGTGTQYNPGDVITMTITLYAFDQNGPGCSDQEPFTITIVPPPTANQPADVTVCANAPVSIPITGSTGATFPWTNSNTAIGLGASGTGNINFNAANVTAQQTGTVTITPMAGSCTGTPVNFSITVNPLPQVNDPANQTVCAGATVNVTFTTPSGNPTYNWTNSNTGIGLGANGTGDISFTTANVSNPTTATVTVTPVENGCTGTPQTFTITVNPAATVVQPANQTVCAGQNVTANFSGSTGATFAWTNSNTAIGLGANGNGNISFTAAGVSATETGTITITPTSPAGCPGTPVNFTITVNPGPTMNDPADQTVCPNTPLSVVFSSAGGNPTYAWTNTNTAIGLGASGNGNINFTSTNPATPQTGTITVTPSENGCTGTPQTFTITVNPAPQVNDPANQTVCAGAAVTVTFTSPSGNPTYAWTNSNAAIGLDVSGTGNISFTAASPANQQTGTITVTPTENGCAGPAQTFAITVNPAATINPPANVTACAGQNVTVNFTGSAGATFAWTNSNTAIGLGTNGTGNLNFTAAGVSAPEMGTITVTPTSPAGCTGTPVNFTITVNPGPVMDDPANQTLCGGSAVSVAFTSPSGNPNYTWTNSNPAIGLGASGSGNINFTAASPATAQTATITVTPTENGCTGAAQTFTITVNPLPVVTPPANVVACSGQPVVVNFAGTPGATFSWVNSNTAVGLPVTGNGNLNFTTPIVPNQEIATITVTPQLGACIGTPANFSITVNPGPSVDPVDDLIACAGDPVSVVFFSPSGNPTYSWTNTNTAIGLGAAGSGNINFVAANVGGIQTGTITVTASLAGCTGVPTAFTITVSPAPTMGQPANATACGGSTVNIAFAGSPGATFQWTNSNTVTGLPASGTGNISFVTANPATQQVSTITVRPVIGGCQGPPRVFTITVNPAPTVNPIANQAVCAGDPVSVAFTSPNNPTFNWTNSNTAIGLPASGSGNIGFPSAMVATPQTATITVTPVQNGCTGPVQTFTIIVSPAPTANQPTNAVFCGGQPANIPLTGSPGASFNWANSNTATGLPASGNGTSIVFTTANVPGQQVSTVTVTPVIGSCSGAPVVFTITVGPAPSMSDPADQTVCSGAIVNINFAGTPGATFSWTNSNTAVGLAASGSGNIGFVAANLAAPDTATVTVTPMLGACSGASQTFVVVVNPAPAVSPVPNRNACAGDSVVLNFTGSPGAIFSWINSNPAIGLPASGTGNLNFLAAQVAVPETATITVTPGVSGSGACPGATITFEITVRPSIGVDSIPDRTACVGEVVSVVFSGPGNPNVAWTNDNPAIGLAAGGTGNVSFTAANVTAPETATITVSPLGTGFAYITNNTSNTVSVIDLASNTVVAVIPVGIFPYGVSVAPDGSLVYVTNTTSGTVSVIDAATNMVVATVPVGTNPQGIAVSPDGSLVLVTNTGSFSVSLLETNTNTVLATIPTPGGFPTGVAFHPGGFLAYVSASNQVLVLDVIAGTIIATIPVGGGAFGVSVSPDGTRVYVACANSDNLYVLDAATNTVLTTVPLGDAPSGVVVSPDGSLVYIANENGATVSVLDAATNTIVATIPVSGFLAGPIGISITPDGRFVYVAKILADEVSVISTVTNTEVGTIPVGISPIAFGNFITPVAACVGAPQTFTITVGPVPVLAQPGAISACGETAISLPFNATAGITVNWANDNPAIGLPASGTGDLSFTTANVATPQTATITATPVLGSCTGTPVSVTITVNPGSNDTLFINSTTCDSALAGIIVQDMTTPFGCDSVVVTTTALMPSNNLAITEFACDPAALGVFTQVLVNQFGCDSTVVTTVLFDITATDSVSVSATTCDTALVGISTLYLVNQFGCDSIVTVNTTLLPSDTTSASATTCNPALVGPSTLYLVNQFGCDSIVLVNTTLLPSSASSVSAMTCDSALVGISTLFLVNQFGCDSIVTVNTTLAPSITTNILATTCDSALVGVSVHYLVNQFDCDSIVTITTTLRPDDSTSVSATTCNPAQVGVSVQNFTNQFGCDSVVTTTTTLLPSSATSLTATTCNPAQAGVSVQNFTNQFGCDSVVTTTTTLLPISATSLMAATCDPAQVGVSVQNLTNQFGCDSVVTTTTTLLPSNTTSVSATTCNPAQVGVSVQNLTNQFGCDSVVTTTTALLPSNATSVSATTCNPAQVGVSVQNLTNQFGCDSIVTTTTTLLPSNATSVSATTCNPAQVGVSVQNLTNQFGCDSVVTTTTTLLPSNATSVSATTCNPAQVGVSVQNLTNQFGCDSIVTTTTTLDLTGCAAVVSVSGTNPPCAGGATGSFTITVTSGLPPLQYNWANSLGGTGSGQITALAPPTTVSNLPAGTYSITVTNPVNGATTTASVAITAPPALVALAATPAPFSGFEVGCAGGSDGSATASAVGGTPSYQFSWSTGLPGPALTNLGAGTYTLTATDAKGCTATATATLNAPPPLVLDLKLDRGDCGDTLVDATVTASGGVGPYSLTVDGNMVPGTTIPSLGAGVHLLAVTDTNGCSADSAVTVLLPPLPSIALPNDTTVIIGNALRIEAVTNLSTWSSLVWQPLPDTACANCLVQEWVPGGFQLIRVTITDTFGCTATDQIRVSVEKKTELYVPNVFRPDRSGSNDVWTISAGPSVVELREVAIFDRWGDQLYLWNNPLPPNQWPGWDGTARGGLKANPGVYVYYLKVLLADGTVEVVKGDVTILE
ncbi:MAG: PKD-like domain-containing protein [Saprospiraceae bacterium]